jgi:hypothetical protein
MHNGWEDRSNMKEDRPIPEFKSYEDMAGFWDTHSLADYWEQTEPAAFEISEQVRKRRCEGWDGEA